MISILKKKKILFVASEYAPGMIPFAASIINAIAQDDRFDVCCICVNSGRKTYKPYLRSQSNPIFFTYPGKKWKKILYKFWPLGLIKMINETIKKQNPDIIHFLTGDFALASYIRHQKSSKICYTVHDMEPHEVENLSFLSPIKRKVINGGYKTCRNAAPNLTTSSKKQFELLRKMYPHKNVAYTNFPSLVTDFIEIGNKCPSEIKNEYSYILFFGNVVEYKGVDNLIAAFESIESSVSTKLVIAGGGATYPTTSKNVIRINRFIDDSEVKSLFERAKLIVYPYKSATMSGVLSLAFFFKKNILLSDVPFFKENASTSTTFFKAGDISDLKEKLLHCLNNNDTIADNAYESTYSINSMVDSYAKFYEEING